MAFSEQTKRNPAADAFSLAMLLLLILSFGWLLYGGDMDSGYAGIGALLAIPFALGALIVRGSGMQYSLWGCLLAPIILFAIMFLAVYFGAAEGLVCIMMVMPLWILSGLGGGLLVLIYNYGEAERDDDDPGVRLKAIGWALFPIAIIFGEMYSPPQWTTKVVERQVIIDAAADEVWPLLVSIPEIDAAEGLPNFTQDWLGVARPSEAKLVERDGKLVRLARWGTDIRFEEQVTMIEPATRLSWRFAFPDDSVQRYTDRHISPDGPTLRIVAGQYQLRSIAPGKTSVTLATSYEMRSNLDWYLAWWGELMLGDVQDNVLAIVKQRAEAS